MNQFIQFDKVGPGGEIELSMLAANFECPVLRIVDLLSDYH